MPALSDVPRNSEEWRAFMQARVRAFGRTLASFVLGFYVFANAVAMLTLRVVASGLSHASSVFL